MTSKMDKSLGVIIRTLEEITEHEFEGKFVADLQSCYSCRKKSYKICRVCGSCYICHSEFRSEF
jgi:hypothetical protein